MSKALNAVIYKFLCQTSISIYATLLWDGFGNVEYASKKNYQVRSGLARLCWWCEPQTHNWYSLCSLMDSICANSVNLVMGIILIYHYTYLIIKCAQFFKSQRFSYRKSVSTLPTLNFNTTCVFCGAATLMPITWTSHACFKFLRI